MSRPPFAPPDTTGCLDKFDKVACLTDTGLKGTCNKQLINTPDFSIPGPPKFSMVETQVCVATPKNYDLKDFIGGAVVVLIIFALVVFNLFRRKTLSDYFSDE